MYLKTLAQRKKKYVLFSKIAPLTNNDLNIGKAVLYSKPLKQRALLFSPHNVWSVHYYYIIFPGVYIVNDLTHLLTCHLIGGGTQKAWPPPHPPLRDASAPMNCSTLSVVIIHYPWQCQPMTEQAQFYRDFYLYSSHAHMRERASDGERGELHHPPGGSTLHLFLSVLLFLCLKTGTGKVSALSATFWDMRHYQRVTYNCANADVMD